MAVDSNQLDLVQPSLHAAHLTHNQEINLPALPVVGAVKGLPTPIGISANGPHYFLSSEHACSRVMGLTN